MKRLLIVVMMGLTFGISAPARADLQEADIFIGQFETLRSCFIQILIKTIVNSQFNGTEFLLLGGSPFGDFSSLVGTQPSLEAGSSVLFGSAEFAELTGIEVDITVTEEQCEMLLPGLQAMFYGSVTRSTFGAGDLAGTLTLPDNFGVNSVATPDGLIDLTMDSYVIASLGGMKEVGEGAGDGGSDKDDGGCGIGGGAGSLLAIGLALFLFRRRAIG